MLTDDQISSRRWRYGCCALEYLYEYVEHEIIASEDKEKWWSKYVQMEFAREVMASTPRGDEDGCIDLECATRVADKYDCLC